jgi:5,10-methylenetetrahydromethanopterin reductase
MTAEFWRQGSTPVPYVDIGSFAQRLESAGWHGLCVGEAPGILPDPYVVLALAARATATLQLGTAVSVPIRHPIQAANAMAAVNGLAPARTMTFCLGRGDGAMKVLQRGPMRVAVFRSYVEDVRSYLHNDVVVTGDGQTTMARLRQVDPSAGSASPRIDVAATGPKMVSIAAAVADSVTFSVGADPARLRSCIQLLRDAGTDCEGDGAPLPYGCFVQLAVTGEWQSADEARQAIRGLVMTHARFSAYGGRPLPDMSSADRDPTMAAVEAMEESLTAASSAAGPGVYGPGVVRSSPAQLSDDFLDRFAIVGPPAYCAERLQELIELGVWRIVIGTTSVGETEKNACLIADHVFPLVRQ